MQRLSRREESYPSPRLGACIFSQLVSVHIHSGGNAYSLSYKYVTHGVVLVDIINPRRALQYLVGVPVRFMPLGTTRSLKAYANGFGATFA